MKSLCRKEARGRLKIRRLWNKTSLVPKEAKKKNDDGRENEEKNKKKKIRKHEGQRLNEREDGRIKTEAHKRAKKCRRSKELCELCEEKEEREVKIRRKLKAESADPESIADKDV